MRYAQRVEERVIGNGYTLTPEEKRRYVDYILTGIENGIELPTQCCLLFVEPKGIRDATYRRAMNDLAGGTLHTATGPSSWGTYVYDADEKTCYVIENEIVKTVIVPDEDQLGALEDFLERLDGQLEDPPSDPILDGPDSKITRRAFLEAADLVKQESLDPHVDELPRASRYEVYDPKRAPQNSMEVDVDFVASYLRWIGRAIPTIGPPVLLLYESHYRFFRHAMELLDGHGLVPRELPLGFNDNAVRSRKERAPGYADIRNALRDRDFARVYILCTHNGTRAALRIMHQHIGGIPEIRLMEEVPGTQPLFHRGTVYAFDGTEANGFASLIRFFP